MGLLLKGVKTLYTTLKKVKLGVVFSVSISEKTQWNIVVSSPLIVDLKSDGGNFSGCRPSNVSE